MTAKEKENQKKTCSWSRWFLFRAKQSSAQFTESDTLKMLARCDIGYLESTSTIRAVVSEFHGDQGPPTLAFDTDTDWMQNDMQKANEITTRKNNPGSSRTRTGPCTARTLNEAATAKRKDKP